MRQPVYFVVSADIAERSGLINSRYRTADNRFILNEDDMRHVRLEPQEYLTGIPAETVDEATSRSLISEGGYSIGPLPEQRDSSAESNPDDGQNSLLESADDSGSPEPDPGAGSGQDNNESENIQDDNNDR